MIHDAVLRAPCRECRAGLGLGLRRRRARHDRARGRTCDRCPAGALPDRLIQAEFACHFGFPLATLRNWEQGIRTRQEPGKALLRLIGADSEAALRALGKAA